MSAAEEIERCDRELAAIAEAPDVGNWLAALGDADWQAERELILAEAKKRGL